MENQSKPQRSKKKLIYLVLLSIVGVWIVSVTIFYFFPIPKSLDRMVKSGGTVERCIYNGAINYATTFELTTLQQSNTVMIMYSPEGETVCTSDGMVGGKKQEPCNKYRLCLPVYGQ